MSLERSLLSILPALAATCAVALLAPAAAPSQEPPEQQPIVAAEEIPGPPAGLEPAVAEQLSKMYEFVVREIEEQETRPKQLAEPIGELGRLYLAYELYDQARRCLQIADRLNPRYFRWPYHLAYLAQQEGALEEAARLYERSLSISPRVNPARIRLAQVYAALNRADAAEWVLRLVLADDPSSAAAQAALGELLVERQRYEEGVALLRSALDQNPGADRLYYPLGLGLRGLGQAAAAREALERRGDVGIRPADPLIDGLAELALGERVSLLRGRSAYAAGRFDEAAAEFRAALEINPESIAGLINLGSTQAQMGDLDGAIATYRRAIELAPGNKTAHLNVGLLLSNQGKPLEALPYLETAANLEPSDGGIRFALADTLQDLGRLEDALLHYRRAAQLDPPGEMARFREGQVLSMLGRYAEARDALEAALAQQPRSLNLSIALARILARAPDPEVRDGERALQLARRLFAARPTLRVLETLAMAHAEAGQCIEAFDFQSQAVEAAEDVDDPALRAELLLMLEHYKSGKPCRYPLGDGASAQG